ncbi:UNVERIFIED_ORG: hypothetical protein J2Y81_007800 [Paraburkholderia sediminicola]|nr:hypothetical protein [Paraburkholderia sediminicola]
MPRRRDEVIGSQPFSRGSSGDDLELALNARFKIEFPEGFAAEVYDPARKIVIAL